MKLEAKSQNLTVTESEMLVAGTRGVYTAEFVFDSTWEGYTPVAVFKTTGPEGRVSRESAIVDGKCRIPWEVLLPDSYLQPGVYGIDGDKRLPTVYAERQFVRRGTETAAPSEAPTPDIVEQLLIRAAASAAEATDAASRAEGAAVRQPYPNEETGTWWLWDAESNAYRDSGISYGAGGGGTTDHSKLANRNATDQHPIGAITGLEAALEGKQPAGVYLTEESDPTVPDWAKAPKKPDYTAEEVGADSSGTAESKVAAHNTGETAHNDIRLLIAGLQDRLNALADSDDTTLDQLSEIVAYIKSNRNLIAAVTTDKVSVTDIVNDLATNVTNKPLSAAQGVALKALIDAITVPDKLPNPYALTFTGAVEGSYDGSEAKTINIPGGTNNIPAGGTDGQMLYKDGSEDYALKWGDAPSGGGDGAAVTPELLYSGTAENVQSFSQDIDFKGHKNFAIVVSGTKGDAAITMTEGNLYIGGHQFVFAYYSAFLSATSETAPKGSVFYTIRLISPDKCIVDFSQFSNYSTPFWEYLQASSSAQSSARTCYAKSPFDTSDEKISFYFSASVPSVSVDIYGF